MNDFLDLGKLLKGRIGLIAQIDPEMAFKSTTIFTRKVDERFNLASVSKLILCVVVSDVMKSRGHNVSQLVAVLPQKRKSKYLITGNSYTLNELICASLLASDNLAALTLSEYVKGEAQYLPYDFRGALGQAGHEITLSLIAQKAANLKMENTQIADPAGIAFCDIQYSTALDLLRLARSVIFDYPQLFEIMQMREAQICSKLTDGTAMEEPKRITHRSFHVRKFDGVVGAKTGTMEDRVELIIHKHNGQYFVIIATGEGLREGRKAWIDEGRMMLDFTRSLGQQVFERA